MRVVEKGWGREEIWADTEGYCGKNLVFRSDSRSSMHFHATKDETWMVQSGCFMVRYIDTGTSEIRERTLMPGDTWRNAPLLPHQLVCFEAGTVLEVSTFDDPKDNYRVFPGDSQQ